MLASTNGRLYCCTTGGEHHRRPPAEEIRGSGVLEHAAGRRGSGARGRVDGRRLGAGVAAAHHAEVSR